MKKNTITAIGILFVIACIAAMPDTNPDIQPNIESIKPLNAIDTCILNNYDTIIISPVK